MAQLPRRGAGDLRSAALAAIAWGGIALAAETQAEGPRLELAGVWHVLVHYSDDRARDAQQLSWEDRIWIFERRDGRLRWTEYPIVVFKDASGRFERLGTHRGRRVEGVWQPSPEQFAQIREGLEVNSRGRRSKLLDAVEGDGWRSEARATPGSASVVSYTESWSVEKARSLPVFRLQATLGSARAESLEGVTLYTSTAVDSSGDLVRGTFERDGTRHGSFRMLRSGPVAGLGDSGERRPGPLLFERYVDAEEADEGEKESGEAPIE